MERPQNQYISPFKWPLLADSIQFTHTPKANQTEIEQNGATGKKRSKRRGLTIQQFVLESKLVVRNDPANTGEMPNGTKPLFSQLARPSRTTRNTFQKEQSRFNNWKFILIFAFDSHLKCSEVFHNALAATQTFLLLVESDRQTDECESNWKTFSMSVRMFHPFFRLFSKHTRKTTTAFEVEKLSLIKLDFYVWFSFGFWLVFDSTTQLLPIRCLVLASLLA